MPSVAVVMGVILWALIAYQAALTWRFWRVLRRFQVDLLPDSQLPHATVVLCLRGADPFLAQ